MKYGKMKILKCRRETAYLACLTVWWVSNVTISDKSNQDSLTKLLPEDAVPADYSSTPRHPLDGRAGWGVFNLNYPLLLLCFPVKIVLFMCSHHENSSGFVVS